MKENKQEGQKLALKDYLSPQIEFIKLGAPLHLLDNFSVEGDLDQYQDEDLGKTYDTY